MAFNSDFQSILVTTDTHVFNVIKVINEFKYKIALVVDNNKKLLGTITDGDIRRALLSGKTLDDTAESIMEHSPLTVLENTGEKEILDLMLEHSIIQVPVVTASGIVVDCEFRDDLREKLSHVPEEHADIWAVLMLGGKGQRLRPLTENTPKPMIEVGGKPILETIISNFSKQGLRKFFFSVNYKANIISDYFGDGSNFGVEINYITEDKEMGTAGSLCMLPGRPPGPFVVMNGDILTDISFVDLTEFHCQHDVLATMCVGEYTNIIPYGIIENSGVEFKTIKEKPTETFFVNAGIYVLDPEVLNLINRDEHLDMPQLFEKISEVGKKSIIYPIHEYWMDIGRPQDLEQAQTDYNKYFGKEK